MADPERQATRPEVDLGATIREVEASTTVGDRGGTRPPEIPARHRLPGGGEADRYELGALAGQGATSQVYAATDRVFDRQVAVKWLNATRADDAKRLGRFVREAKLTAALEHPNVAPIYDLDFTESGAAYFTMRLVTGAALGSRLKLLAEGVADPVLATCNDRVTVLLRVLDALASAHAKGVLHRDLKPDNILLGQFGEVFLVDWGCAIQTGEVDTRSSRLVGTPNYMSPEQARSEPADVRSDVYCVGVTLFELLTLRLPTLAKDGPEFWTKKRAGIIDAPTSEEIRRVPRRLLAIALKAIAADPAARYQDALALAADLRAWQAGLAVSAYHEGPLERLLRFHRRHWRGLWSTVAALLLITVSLLLLVGEKLQEVTTWGLPVVTCRGDTLPTDWVSTVGGFAASDGRWVSTGDAANLFFHQRRLVTPVAIEYEARMDPGAPACDISAAWTSAVPTPSTAVQFPTLFQIGAFDNSFAALSYRGHMLANADFRIESDRWYTVRAEIDRDRLRLLVDGRLICSAALPAPLTSGWIGIYAYYPGKSFRNLRISTKGLPAKVSALALGERDFADGLLARAAEVFAEVATTHAGSQLGDEARYRQGLALREAGQQQAANDAWATVSGATWRARIMIHHAETAFLDQRVADGVAGLDAALAISPDLRQLAGGVWMAAVRLRIEATPEPLPTLESFWERQLASEPGFRAQMAWLLSSSLRHERVVHEFSDCIFQYTLSMIAVGRGSEVIRDHADRPYARDMALIATGQFEKVLELTSSIVWTRNAANQALGRNLIPDKEHIFDAAYLGQAATMLAQVTDAQAHIYLLLALGRDDEAVAVREQDPVSANEQGWHAVLLANRLELTSLDSQVRPPGAMEAKLRSVRCLDRLAAGDADAWPALRTLQPWPEVWTDYREWFDVILFVPVLEWVAGDHAAGVRDLARIADLGKDRGMQRPYWVAMRLLGRCDDAAFLAQPYQVGTPAMLHFLHGLIADQAGDQTAALQAYRAFFALPPWQRLISATNRDATIERMVRWRLSRLESLVP